MNGRRKHYQIGWNNHLQTLFQTHSYIMSNWKNVKQNVITSKHYLTLNPSLEKGSLKSNHLQTLYNTFQKTPSQTQSVR